MNIWYLHHYATPSSIAGLHRPFEFGKYFLKDGHNVTVFTSSYLHYAGENMIEDKRLVRKENYDGIDTVYVRTLGYSSGVKRIVNMFQFYKRVIKVGKSDKLGISKPDVIIASSPHPLVMMAGNKLAKKYKVPCICEVRDFWPEVFFTSGSLKKNGLIGKFLLNREKKIYKDASALVFLKEGDHTYINENKWGTLDGGPIDENKCYYVNNGVDLTKFYDRQQNEKLVDSDLESDKFKVVYSGTIRPINNVGLLLDAAKCLDDDTLFLIYGAGNCIEDLQSRIDSENITNVKIKGYVDNKYVPYVLSKSSVNVLNYSADKYNWSRGNSSNKLFEYLASGKPVISTVKMGYDILEKNNCGFSTEVCCGESIANFIKQIKSMDKGEYQSLCDNARETAKEFDMPILANKYLSIILEVKQNFENSKKGV